MTASPSTLRWCARVVATVVVFAPLLARHSGYDLRLIVLAALTVAFIAALSHGLSVVFSLVLSVVGFAVLENVAGVSDVSSAMTFIRPVLHAALLAPLTFAMHRHAAHDSDDARDRVMLAASVSAFAALCDAVRSVSHARPDYYGPYYKGTTAVLLGPTLMSLVVIAGVGALGALVLSGRWLLRWRRLLATEGVRIEPLEQWQGAMSPRPWLRLMGMANDGVVVLGRSTKEGGTYREGDVEQAITTAPMHMGQVTNALWLRLAAAGVVLGAVALLAATQLRTLRW